MEYRLTRYLAALPDTFFPVERFQQHTESGMVKFFNKGSLVLRPGEATSALIYVISGKVRVNKMIDDGRERLAYYAGQHGIIGRLYETCNDIYIIALEDSEVCFFTQLQLKEIFRRDEDLIFDLLRNYLSKVSYFIKQSTEIDYFNPTIRVVRLLYELLLTSGVRVESFFEIPTQLSLTDISEITGAHYVTVSKVFGHLKKQHIAERKKHKIIIYDMEKLKRLTQETQILKMRDFGNFLEY
ncbi:Crp/Fnr family transcriptional regulator [Desulfitobacterium chlororespirans]|uniref:CRP/FNR family transcriptional regulator, anaerobic regulatory protein n=1 Tax=Desulfitobacterium chlororespirans DSM 11544 TaxID=1121395 RepID=A0A1M7RVB3_9FIRM|nr:Crp/Fnr family transcriptional regulator [Desulfitobacterium chlororespirans]SHN50235.1 CRP/FNR family transcriptional regulator, anaerobic regulatory protein [Desulfitobacterium chlororespirans DSM 11544]